AFMKEHRIPLDELDSGKPKVLVVGSDSQRMIDSNGADGKYEMKAAATGYEAGLLTHEFLPDVILMGVLDSAAEQVAICRSIKQNPDLQHIRVVVSGRVPGVQAAELMQAGANAVMDVSATLDKVLQDLQPQAS
ncbi:MAG TPA: hypothetical protein VHP11_16035, partial [Tepidisphaeraceae bacterium]|nr:hypothetical protein [Tepidisphaeraceae bacterium]